MENNTLTLGSLFDGSGGFPLGGVIAGIKPVWSAEIEPFPIRVTEKRMPGVRQLGDISKINGADIPPVDIITFGSPCQDMSIAGRRDGLDGSRSSLFYEAIRIIKEMRCATDGKYPRFAVWENVKGAFSSNGGEDFKAVLQEFCRVSDEGVSVPRCDKWKNAGCILGESFSVAWRLLDAQHWGVPQRRERIYLVADFAGAGAGNILFESEGVSGYSAEGFRAWQRAAGGLEEGAGEAGIGIDGYNGAVSDKIPTLGVNCGMSTGRCGVIVLNDQGGQRMDVTEDVTCTLRAEAHHPPVVPVAAGFCTEHSAKARGIGYQEETSPTLRAGTVPAAMMFENHGQDSRYTGPLEVSQTVSATFGMGGNNQPFVVQPPMTLKIRSGCEGGGKGALIQEDKSATLGTHNDQTLFAPRAFGVCSKSSHSMMSDNPHSGFYEAETSRCLDANGGNPTCNQGGIAIVGEEPKCYDVRFTSENSKVSRGHVYETDTSRAVTTDGNSPGGNHGGVAVVGFDRYNGNPTGEVAQTLNAAAGKSGNNMPIVALEGNGSRPSHKGDGYKETDAMYTLNTVEQHGVAYGLDRTSFNSGQKANYNFAVDEEVEPTMVSRGSNAVGHPVYHSSKNSYHTKFSDDGAVDTLVATDFKDPPTVSEEPYYIVRRLTPIECARLQGFPDWWCDALASDEPDDEEVRRWMDIFETHRKAIGSSSKPKTENQVRKWLKNPYSDSAAYKMWGNGVALPNVVFVLSGIVYYAQFPTELL